MNIKRSLTLRFSLLVALLLTAFSLVIYQNYASYRKIDYFERLTERSTELAKLMIDAPSADSLDKILLRENNIRLMTGQKTSVIDSTNQLISDPRRKVGYLDPQLIEKIRKKKYHEFSGGDTQYVGFNFNHKGKQYVVVGTAMDQVGKKKLDYLGRVIIISLIISLLVTAVLGWNFASRALKPINKVIREADQITARNLHKRLPVNETVQNDEIALLGATFNKMLDRLEASFVMQKNFVSNASHEFRTPVTAMKAQIEVMLLQERSKEEYIKTLRSLDEDIDHFIQLVLSLSELAKADVDSLAEEPVKAPLIEIVAESRSELLRSKPRYRIDLQIENLPETESENYIAGNTSLIKSAIKNLMENACKFSPDQKCEVMVEFSEHDIIISVTDEGIGIDEKELPHIFEPFYRANDTRGISGHGIGLSLVKKIVDLHNGTIKVESIQSKGTRMTVTFPHMKG